MTTTDLSMNHVSPTPFSPRSAYVSCGAVRLPMPNWLGSNGSPAHVNFATIEQMGVKRDTPGRLGEKT